MSTSWLIVWWLAGATVLWLVGRGLLVLASGGSGAGWPLLAALAIFGYLTWATAARR